MAGDGFRIATGYVEIETHYDQDKVTKAAKSAMGGAEREGRRSGARTGLHFGGGFLGGIFQSMPSVAAALPSALPKFFASPVGIAAAVIGGMFVAALGGAILGSGALLGIGAGLTGLLVYGLKDNPQVKAAAKSLGDTIKKTLKDAAAPMAPSLIGGMKVFESYIPQAGEKLKTIFTYLPLNDFGRNLGAMLNAFLEPISKPEVLAPFGEFLRTASEQFPRIAQYAGEFFAMLMKHGPLFADAFGIVVSIFGNLLKVLGFLIIQTAGWLVAFATFWNFLTNAVEVGWKAIKAAFSASLNWIKSTWNTVWGAVKSFFSSIWSGIQGAYNSAKNALQSAFGAMGNWLRSTWNSLWSGIKSFFSSIWSGITGAFNSVRSTVSGIASGMVSNVRGAINGLSSIPGTVGRFFSSMVSTIGKYIGSAVSTVRGLPGKITSAVGNLGSLLYNAGKQIIQGLINGISNMIGSLRSKLGSITSMLPDWKGPMSVDMRILEPSGQAIMQGFMKGIDK
ncbi:MAG TPA: hypothetical protein VGD51_08695, partial [Nocardioidaceae bacterium]